MSYQFVYNLIITQKKDGMQIYLVSIQKHAFLRQKIRNTALKTACIGIVISV